MNITTSINLDAEQSAALDDMLTDYNAATGQTVTPSNTCNPFSSAASTTASPATTTPPSNDSKPPPDNSPMTPDSHSSPKSKQPPKANLVITDEQRQAFATLDAWLNPAQAARLANQGSCEDWAGILELKNRLRPLFAPPTSDL